MKESLKDTPTTLAAQLESAFNQIGTSMMSNDFAAKLLAYLYVFGGGNEAVTLHEGLNAGILIAQEKFKIKGGCIPDKEGVKLIQQYIKEAEAAETLAKLNHSVYLKNPKGLNKSFDYFLTAALPWLNEIYERYNLNQTGRVGIGKPFKI